MKQSFKRILSMFCALMMLLGCFSTGAFATEAMAETHDGTIQIGTQTCNYWSIVSTQTTWAAEAGKTLGGTVSGLNIDLPDALALENMGLYFHVTLDAATAALLNSTSGDAQIELRNAGGSDAKELQAKCCDIEWKAGENKILFAMGQDAVNYGFDVHSTITYFRLYRTKATQAVSATVHEIAIVDVTGIDLRKAGSEFGADDTYLQMSDPLTTSPSTIEASVKLDKIVAGQTAWKIGLPTPRSTYKGLSNGGIFTTSAADETAYGIAAGTEWRAFNLAKGAGLGTEQMKFTALPIPTTYTKADLALTFWMYWKPATTGTPFNLRSYIELSNNGGDKNEVYWRTDTYSAFKNLKDGWNKIVLPLSDGTLEKDGGDIDVNNIGYFRIWGEGGDGILATEPYVIGLTAPQVELLVQEDENDLPTWTLGLSTPRSTYNGLSNGGIFTTSAVDETTYGIAAGTEWRSFRLDKGAGLGTEAMSFTALPIPTTYTKADLALTFWMYWKPDTTGTPFNLKSYIELSESRDKNVVYWRTDTYEAFQNLKEGWNKIVLPLSDGTLKNGGIDVNNIGYFRIWGEGGDGNLATEPYEIGLTAFEIVAHDDPTVTVDASTIDTSDVYTIISNQGTTEQNPLSLFVTKDGNPGFIWGGEGYVAKDFNAATGDWVDLALVFDAANARFLMYADAQLIATVATDATALGAATVAHSIGANAAGGARFKGMMADLRLWSDVRTQAELDACRIKDKNAYGSVENGLNAATEGLMGAWQLADGLNYVLGTKEDLSANDNDLIFCGSRKNQWEDYEIPTDVIGEDYYTMVFIPDTQNLVTGEYTQEWLAAAQWIADNVENENIVHVIGAGDNTWNDTLPEYSIAKQGWDLFASKVSWSNMIGNHDYPWWDYAADGTRTRKSDRDTTNYANCFGLEYINATKGAENFGGYFEDPYGLSTTENAYYRFTVNGTPWMILQLEYHPRVHVIEWANEIVQRFSDDNVILTTHSYIGGDSAAYSRHWMTYTEQDAENGGYIGSLLNPPAEWNSAGGATDNSSEEPIWTHLIYVNDNIKMLLCGHSETTDGHVLTRWDKNAAGNTVPQTMINGQVVDEKYFEDYAMGMLGILRFSADGSRVEIQYYSPYHDSSYHPSNQGMRSLALTLNEKEEIKGTDGLIYALNADGKGYTVTGYQGTALDVIVPATYLGLPVTEYAGSIVAWDGDGPIVLEPDEFGTTTAKVNSLTLLSKTMVISGVIDAKTIICGYGASTAQRYAAENGNEFIVLPEIAGAGIELGKDIAINYTVYLPDDKAADAEMVFTMNGHTTRVKGTATTTPGKYRFSLTGKGPHMMTDIVSAQLVCGGEVLDSYDNYSIKQYCLNMLGRIESKTIAGYSEAQYQALKTLLLDLLEYGAKAQLYANYKPAVLANEGMSGATEFVPLGDEYKMPALEKSTNENCLFYSAAVELKDVLTIRVRFAAAASDLDNIKVVLGGKTYTKSDFKLLGACPDADITHLNVYEISTEAIYATKLEESCNATLYVNGVACQTLSYSVANYVYSKQNDATIAHLADLVKSIRNYGLSAVAFRNAK